LDVQSNLNDLIRCVIVVFDFLNGGVLSRFFNKWQWLEFGWDVIFATKKYARISKTFVIQRGELSILFDVLGEEAEH
jgi:hypothetical protein